MRIPVFGLSTFSVAIALDVNVLLPILDLLVESGLLTPGIVEVS